MVDLPVVMEEAPYHIAIEALNNAIKHAAAASVSISLRTDDTSVDMEIADDSKGFDPGSDSAKGGMRLAGMQRRAEELGGTLVIHSVPGQGTTIIASVPYHTNPRKRGTMAFSRTI